MTKIILVIEGHETIITANRQLNLPTGVGVKCVTTKELIKGQVLDITLALQNLGTLGAVIVGGYLEVGDIRNGWEMTQQLKSAGVNAPIIGCHGDPSVSQKFLKAGANEFVERGMSNPTAPLKKALSLIK